MSIREDHSLTLDEGEVSNSIRRRVIITEPRIFCQTMGNPTGILDIQLTNGKVVFRLFYPRVFLRMTPTTGTCTSGL